MRSTARFLLPIQMAVTAAALLTLSPAAAGQAPAGAAAAYGPAILRARVEDRFGRPVAGLHLAFHADLDGQALRPEDGRASTPVQARVTVNAVTDAQGIAAVPLGKALPRSVSPAAFRGTIRAEVVVAHDEPMPVCCLDSGPLRLVQDIPESPRDIALPPPALHVFEMPSRLADGFPVWAALNGRTDRIVVVLEGFDLYNKLNAPTTLRLIASAADAVRRQGVAILMVDFPDSHTRPDRLAPLAARAIRAAAALSGRKAAVAGLSMGGIVARWALCSAEAEGAPLPVHTLLLLDSPNRGVNLNPALEAMTLRYGTPADKAALKSDAARALLNGLPENVRWRRVGIAPLDRFVPVSWTLDTSAHDAFYGRLRALNGHNGYPQLCRVVAVANSSRHVPPSDGALLHLWLPFGCFWTARAEPADHAAGTLLPAYYRDRFVITRPFGLAGAYLRSAPTFLLCSSALDADADETPPFAAWYARPDGLPPLGHDEVDPGAATFAIRAIVTAPW